MTAPKIPLGLFAIPFGLAGLAEAWTALASGHHAPVLVSQLILLVAAASWLAVGAAYRSHLVTAPGSPRAAVTGDLLDPIASPFASLALIVPILLASDGLFPQAASPGRVITDVFIALTVLLGGWFTGRWILGPLELDRFHPGYFLPTVAGGLIASYGAAVVGQQRLAEVLLGFGVISWIVVGSLILARLFFRPLLLLPPPQPTMAIMVAPAAVASLAWFAIHGQRIDMVSAFLAGYAVLMVIAQLRLLPAYLRLPFMPSTWAFTFSWAAVAAAVIGWLQRPSRRATECGSTSSSPSSPHSSAASPSALSSRSAATSSCPCRRPLWHPLPGPLTGNPGSGHRPLTLMKQHPHHWQARTAGRQGAVRFPEPGALQTGRDQRAARCPAAHRGHPVAGARGVVRHRRLRVAVAGQLRLPERQQVLGVHRAGHAQGLRQHDRDAAAVPLLEQSLELASRVGDTATMAEALRHLGIAAHRGGDLDEARRRLEEATRLRRQTGQLPSAAANMIGLAYIAAAQQRTDDVRAILDEASAIATSSHADRILQQVTEARGNLGG